MRTETEERSQKNPRAPESGWWGGVGLVRQCFPGSRRRERKSERSTSVEVIERCGIRIDPASENPAICLKLDLKTLTRSAYRSSPPELIIKQAMSEYNHPSIHPHRHTVTGQFYRIPHSQALSILP